MVLPLIISLYFKEACAFSFLITIFITLVIGLGAVFICRTRNTVIYAKEGFVIVAFSWIALSAFGALPFYLSGEIPSFVDAIFETVSGFTTTGASILNDVESMSKGLLFWRSFTHWVGGMGVLVFVMALLPNVTDRSIHIMRAEMPGPIVGKLLPKVKDTAKILYIIYIVITATEIILLKFGGMGWFDSVVHSFGTAGTGGFGVYSDSVGRYSPYIQWVITIFMLICGINFNLFYLILIKRFHSAFKSTELWTYLGIFGVSTVLITINVLPTYENFSTAIRHSAFQVSSIITTTGYSTVNFDEWPLFSKSLILILMFIGGCAGSTAGGFKISRIIILAKQAKNELRRMLHPRSVNVVKFEDRPVEASTLTGVNTYLSIYIFCIAIVFIILSFEDFGFITNFSAAVTCFNNVGPGFDLVGPAASFSEYSVLSKIVLSFAMLLGRLEIFPLIILAYPATWNKK